MPNPQLVTKFLPPERQPMKIIEKSYKEILSIDNLDEILNAVSCIAIIINSNRQIVFANSKTLETIGEENINKIISNRPGEMLGCIHSENKFCGCGTTEECTVCGIALSIKHCFDKSEAIENECRIIAKTKKSFKAYDFSITATPMKLKSSDYIILSLVDISDKKRREWLESIFYHDIINIAGGLSGLLEMMEMINDDTAKKKYLKMASLATKNLLDEIISQRSLSAAENGELEVTYEKAGSLDLVKEIMDMLAENQIAKGKKIKIAETSVNMLITTNPTLLKRILINLLKNALEASAEKETVEISCSKVDSQIEFAVSNSAFIPKNVQHQIFQRSFSTKSRTRGLGTFSVKLLTEHYLGGKVSFTSDKKNGTKFTVRFPVHLSSLK